MELVKKTITVVAVIVICNFIFLIPFIKKKVEFAFCMNYENV